MSNLPVTASRTAALGQQERKPCTVLELTVDKCLNSYGIAPCTVGVLATGFAQSAAYTSLTLDASASASVDAYKNMLLRIISGGGIGQSATILGSRKNNLIWSNNFSNWIPNPSGLGAPTSATGVLAPDGTLTANTLTVVAIGGMFSLSVPNILADEQVAYCWAKKATSNGVRIQAVATSDGIWCGVQATFNLTTGISAAATYGNCVATGVSAIAIGGGYYLCEVRYKYTTGVIAGNSVWLFPYLGNGDGIAGVSDTAIVWEAVHGLLGSGITGYPISTVGSAAVGVAVAPWVTVPRVASGYSVINRPAACYNTYSTCQVKAAYVKGTQIIKFVSRGVMSPLGETLRPYLLNSINAPTNLDFEAGLAARNSVTISLADETDNDSDGDPYYATRSIPAQSTYWSRWLVRNRNYFGRLAKLRRGFVADPWNWNLFLDELYIIDNFAVDSSGQIKLTLKDPLKLADNNKIPLPTNGAVQVALGLADLSVNVGAGLGTQYADPATSGKAEYIRIGSEIINYTAKAGDILSWPSTAYRGVFGSTVETHAIGDGVQLCRAFLNQTIPTVLTNLLTESGIDPAYISPDVVLESTQWFGGAFNITSCISSPEQPSALLADILKQIGAVMWWSPQTQKVEFKAIMPTLDSIPVWTDEANFIQGSMSVKLMDQLRLTQAAISYALKNATGNLTEPRSYQRTDVIVDAAAQSTIEYGDVRPLVIRSRWFTLANSTAMVTSVWRMLNRLRDAPKLFSFKLDPKDYTRPIGSLIGINTTRNVNVDGSPKQEVCFITKSVDLGTHIEVEARSTNFKGRYAFIAPAGTADYPADTLYAHISNSDGLMPNGDSGYIII